MAIQQPISVKYDPLKNIVRTAFSGDIGIKEAQEYEKLVSAVLATIPTGFYLLTDLSQLQSMDIHCMPNITRTMEQASRHGIKRVVRIVPDPSKDIGFNIMSLFHYPHGLPIITCENKEEAERALS